MKRRLLVSVSLSIVELGLVVAAVGVQMLGGLAAGLVAYGAVAVISGVSAVVLWA